MDKETLKALGVGDDMVDKILTIHTAGVDGLKNKRDELLGKLRKANDKLGEFSEIDLKALQDSADKLADLENKNAKDNGEFMKLYNTLKDTSAKDKKSLEKKVTELKNKNIGMGKRNEVNVALMQHEVVPKLTEIAIQTIIPDVAVDDSGNFMVGDKSVKDYVNEWVAGDVGKHFIKADNSGGGSNGSGGGDGHATEAGWFKKGSKTHNLTKQAQLKKTNPELYNKLKTVDG